MAIKLTEDLAATLQRASEDGTVEVIANAKIDVQNGTLNILTTNDVPVTYSSDKDKSRDKSVSSISQYIKEGR